MSENIWFAYCALKARDELKLAAQSVDADAKLLFVPSACRLRSLFGEEQVHKYSAIVGGCDEGISDLNLAAALVHDGYAQRVVLVTKNPSQTLLLHAKQAKIDKVIDLEKLIYAEQSKEEISPESSDVFPTQMPSCGVTTTAKYTNSHEEDQSCVVASQTGSLEAKRLENPAEVAPIFVFGSGRGGVGKTALAAMSALIAASWGMKVALFDLDLACGNLFSFFGLPRAAAMETLKLGMFGVGRHVRGESEVEIGAKSNRDLLDEASIQVTENIRLWGPCARPESAESISPLVEKLLLTAASTYDVVLVDTSSTCTDAVAQAFQLCDRLLLVHDEYSGGFGSLARTSALAVRLGVARTRIVRVANRGDRRTKFDLMAGRAEVGLETARAVRVLEGGPEVSELLAAGKAQELVKLDSDFVRSSAHLLAQILSEVGKIPDTPAAQEAVIDPQASRRPFRLFRKKACS
ncbi:MAG: hypothetical protein KIC37_07850 [Coriobacteriaceae bacterium]|nr:hypothetical protein [Coriobacteriaceae bacterium]